MKTAIKFQYELQRGVLAKSRRPMPCGIERRDGWTVFASHLDDSRGGLSA